MKTPNISYFNSGTSCPKCKVRSTCGCKSCNSRRKMPRQRKRKFVDGELEQCPYCRGIFHCDNWLDSEAEDYNINKQL